MTLGTTYLGEYFDDVAAPPATSGWTIRARFRVDGSSHVGYTPPAFGPSPSGGPNITPTAANTGVEPWGQPFTKVINGDLTASTAGQVIGPYWHIKGRVIIKAPNVIVDRCLIEGSGPRTTGSGLIDASSLTAVNWLVTDSTLIPATPSLNWNAAIASVSGTFRRCKWTRGVDGMSIFNANTGHQTDPITILVEACYGDLAAFYSPDPSHASSDNQTHNDVGSEIQGAGSGSHVEFRYCNFQGFCDPTLLSEDGTDAGVRLSGVRVFGDIGRASTNPNTLGGYSRRYPYLQTNSAFQTTHEIGGQLHGIDIHHCLLDGGQATIGMAVHSTGSNGFDNFIYNNVFGGNTSSGQDAWLDNCSAWGNGSAVITTPGGRTFSPWTLAASETFSSDVTSHFTRFNGANPNGGTWATGHMTYDGTNHRMTLLASTTAGVTTLGGGYWNVAASAMLGGAWEADFHVDSGDNGWGLVVALVPETGTVPANGQINLYELRAAGTYGTWTSGGASNVHQSLSATPSTDRALLFPSSSTRPQAGDFAAGNYQLDVTSSVTLRCEWQPGKYVATFVNGELRSWTTDSSFIPSTKSMNLAIWQEVYGAGTPVTSKNAYLTGLRAYTR